MRQEGRTLSFVPTMGFLHDGHLSLMQAGRQRGDRLIISIFVNPTQFAPNEDFDSYPRDFERDLDLAREVGVDVVFAPQRESLYPDGYQTYVRSEGLSNHLCGISRPIFFTGVATIVTKLFHIVMPTIALFGEKDYQQLTVIRRMVQDLNMGIEIIGCPTVREPDGLAMSSRNAYLKPEQRAAALSLSQALFHASKRVQSGETETSTIIEDAFKRITAHAETEVDYIAVVDAETLVDIEAIDRPARMALAVRVGTTRLIDNIALNP